MSGSAPRAVIVGLAGTSLTASERELFLAREPAGFILFARNIETPVQVRALTAELRSLQPARPTPVLVDQEGGRVMRLRPPHWPALPAAARLGLLAARDPVAAGEAAVRLGELIGGELAAVGINVDCAPCLDVARPDTTVAIGDRAFAADPRIVASLGQGLIEGLQAAGVQPVIKHLPGHGRARVDSHAELPVVDAGIDELMAHDIVPFRQCRSAPFAITAHVVYTAIDPHRPATQSARVIAELIRGAIGFEGILLTDDLGMSALRGSVAERALRALEAGCDIALQCSGVLADAQAVLEAVPPLPAATAARLTAALRHEAADPAPMPSAALARLETLLAVA